jgi:hypothetical protein
LTGVDAHKEKIQFSDSDVSMVNRWKGHQQCITYITFVPDLGVMVSSSFEGNIYMWNRDCEKVGSLVLGTDKGWSISIDKGQRNEEERQEAIEMLEITN